MLGPLHAEFAAAQAGAPVPPQVVPTEARTARKPDPGAGDSTGERDHARRVAAAASSSGRVRPASDRWSAPVDPGRWVARPAGGIPGAAPDVVQRIMYAIITQRQREQFEANLELDFAHTLPGAGRFRVNMYRQRDSLGAAFRLIPFEIKKLEDLGIPPVVANFSMLPRGFVLVTGPTGSGKSTTLASLVDLANRNRHDHIMTVEDPIEFLHEHQNCLVNQREVGADTKSFGNALKHVLRQDPDIILVGEMRDLETIQVALTAAETGHLVFATLHTQDAAQTIDRVIDVFPAHQQQQIRVQLAGSLAGVVCQTLCRSRDGRGRVAATEVLVATPAIRNLIREGKTPPDLLRAAGRWEVRHDHDGPEPG